MRDVQYVVKCWAQWKCLMVLVMLITGWITTPYDESSEIALGAGNSSIRPFFSWDALYFHHIAAFGYSAEKQWAFLPLYPMVSRSVSRLLVGVPEQLAISVSLLIVSNAAHLLATIVLYYLTVAVFGDQKKAKISAILFAISHASVQLTAAYSESLCALLSFTGFLLHYTGHLLFGSVVWALAGLTRSNAVTLSGFFVYSFLHTRQPKMLIYAVITCLGFMSYLRYAESRFCRDENGNPNWCNSVVPNIYSHVQKEYWNVGFLRYYTPSQAPNFLIALPMTIISCHAISSACKRDPRRFLTLGLGDKSSSSMLPHYYHLMFMLTYTLLFAHVQIMHRLFTFMPIIYWHMADMIMNGSVFTVYYSGLYSLVNAVLFAAFYPPA